MSTPLDSRLAFSRLNADQGLVSLFSEVQAREVNARVWGGIRVHHLQAGKMDVPAGHQLNHLLGLHFGGAATCELNLDGGGWQPQRTPVHGLSVFPAGVPYALRTHEESEFLAVEIASGFPAEVLGPTGEKAELRLAVGAQDVFAKHVLLALAEELRLSGGAETLRAESLGTALVAHLVDRGPRTSLVQVAALPSPKLRRVLDYVAAHLDATLKLQFLAEMVEMDVFRFTRAFKQSTGLSPHRYVLEARINRAKDLLRSSGLSITEIALETGFATPSHFSVTFRRIAGVTPREYRDGTH